MSLPPMALSTTRCAQSSRKCWQSARSKPDLRAGLRISRLVWGDAVGLSIFISKPQFRSPGGSSLARRLGPRRFLRRGGLITLSLSAREPAPPSPAFAPDPEITKTDIWLRRLSPAHDGLRIVQLTDLHHSLFT